MSRDKKGDRDEDSEGRSFVPDFLKKAAVASLGAVFMGEEGVRTLAGQLKIPKEMLGVVLDQAEKTKDDLSRVVSEELRRFLQSDKVRREFLKLISGMTVEVRAEFRLVPRKDDDTSAEATHFKVTEIKARPGGKRSRKESPES
jgi:hypothetical protein